MLLWLTEILAEFSGVFNVFQYITFRAMVGAVTGLSLTLLFGPVVIRQFSQRNISESIRQDGPTSHHTKAGTPTMGGIMIVVSIVIAALLWCDLTSYRVWIVLAALVGFAFVGFLDDYRKYREQKGISAGLKFFLQSLLGLTIAIVLFVTATIPEETELIVPLFKDVIIPLGFGFVILTYLMIVGMSNAVNLADGLDGLAIMPAVMIAAALGFIAYLVGHVELSAYLFIPNIPGSAELAVLCGIIAGSGLGFLWFNAYPAQVFMGDVGALSIGATLGVIGVLVRHEIVLLIMSGIFVLETASVIVQVASYKLTGKRVFQMAPLHHHFELKGWPESRVIIRFWIISFVLVLIGLSMLKLR